MPKSPLTNISASTADSKPQRIAAIYVRVSDPAQIEGGFPEAQKAACLKAAAAQGYDVLPDGICEDLGLSGDWATRPAWRRLLAMIRARSVAAVFVAIQDRLARKASQQMLLMDEALEHGVDLHVDGKLVSADRASRFVYGIQALVAEDQKALMLERTRAGIQVRIKERGHPFGGQVPFGYRRVIEPHKGHFEIDEAEARTVGQIFDWCVAGVATWSIAQRLNDMNIPRKAGGAAWYPAGVRSILGSPAYIGRLPTSKHRTVKRYPIDTPDGVKIREIRQPVDASQWIWLECSAIISERLFNAAQAQLQRNKELSRRNMKQRYLLRGRWLKCASCGWAMAGFSLTNKYGRAYFYYGCTSRNLTQKGRRCPGSIRCDEADRQVWGTVTAFLLMPAAVLKHLEQSEERHESEREQYERDHASIQRALKQCDADDARWIRAYDKEAIDADELRIQRAQIQERRQRLQDEADALQAKLNAIALSAEQAQHLVRYSGELIRGIVEERVERIVKAVESDCDDDLGADDADLAAFLREHWEDSEDWERRRISLEVLRQDIVEQVLASQRDQTRAQLDALSIEEKQALLDQLGIVAYWTRGERLKIIGNFALEYLIENDPL